MIGPRTLSHASIIAAIHTAVQEGNAKAELKMQGEDHSKKLDLGDQRWNKEAGMHPGGGSVEDHAK